MQISTDLMIRIAYALGVGILIGLERSVMPKEDKLIPRTKEELKKPNTRLLGVRTYSILSLAGFTAALIGNTYPTVTPIIIAGLLILIIAFYVRTPSKDAGITTEVAAITCSGLGLLCYSHPQVAGSIALIITVILALKRFMKKAVKRLQRIELTDTLKFLIIIMIVLPLLPNKTLDPYGVFNPYKVMILVILISGISFVGYFLTKFLGAQKGLGLTGLVGGLTSSTAVTAAMSDQAKKEPILSEPCAFAIVLANATMFARVLVVVALLDWELMTQLVISIGTMTMVAMVASVILWMRFRKKSRTGREKPEEISLKNPFSMAPAIKFALFFILILFIAKVAKIYLGNKGLYLASLVSGLADVDAITLSIAEQTKELHLARSVGAIGITIAVVANSVVKSAIAVYSGGLKFGKLVAVILMAATLAGLGVLVIS